MVLFGRVVKISLDNLPQAPTLHSLDLKPYDQLPAYLAYFDVALIPFATNETTRFLSPTTTLVYMAAHKHIVSTPIKDVIDLYGNAVRVTTNPDDHITRDVSSLIIYISMRQLAQSYR